MLRQSPLVLLLACGTLSGCLNFTYIAGDKGRSGRWETSSFLGADEFDIEDRSQAQTTIAGIPNEVMREEVSETLEGSQVSIVDEADRRFLGTLLRTKTDNLVLMNCLCREAVPAPNGQEQCRTSYVAYQSIDTTAMTNFTVVSPPPKDFVAPVVGDGGDDICFDEMVFKSGRRQRWAPWSEVSQAKHQIKLDDVNWQSSSTAAKE